MELIKVARIPPVLAAPDMTVASAAVMMVEKQVGSIVVVDAGNRVLGIFTERDNLIKVTAAGLDPKKTPLSKVMSSPVVTAAPDMSVEDALTLMVRSHFRHLPIVDKEKRVIGITSIRYLLMRRLGEKQATLDILEAYVGAGGPG
jgi:CBS domain-containing protein